MAVLKLPMPGSEKGVLFVMFSDMFRVLHAGMDMPRLLADHAFVFELWWSGYCHPGLLEYTRWQDEIFIFAAERDDFAFLRRIGSNLAPVYDHRKHPL